MGDLFSLKINIIYTFFQTYFLCFLQIFWWQYKLPFNGFGSGRSLWNKLTLFIQQGHIQLIKMTVKPFVAL